MDPRQFKPLLPTCAARSDPVPLDRSNGCCVPRSTPPSTRSCSPAPPPEASSCPKYPRPTWLGSAPSSSYQDRWTNPISARESASVGSMQRIGEPSSATRCAACSTGKTPRTSSQRHSSWRGGALTPSPSGRRPGHGCMASTGQTLANQRRGAAPARPPRRQAASGAVGSARGPTRRQQRQYRRREGRLRRAA